MDNRIVAIAGGSGFIGRAIARRIAAIPSTTVRVLTRNPAGARAKLKITNCDFVQADVTLSVSLKEALKGVNAVVNATQFDGYPVENPRRGLTFERIDFGGTSALLEAARQNGVAQFIYISGAAADENSEHPAFRAKGLAERAIRESRIPYTIFRPSLVYGPEDKVVNGFVKALRMTPVFPVPGTGHQKVQPVLVDDLAACVALALSGKGANGAYDVGGPDLTTFDEMMRTVMEAAAVRRPIVHVPERLMRTVGALGEMLPTPVLSRDAVTFVTADNACNIEPLMRDFGIQLTPMRTGLAYLAKKKE
jgi:nucleoside-diphosphate-sugar epimerase